MDRKRIFWVAFWQGLASPGLVFAQPPSTLFETPAPGRSDLEAMRGDWERVGADFRHVIAREEANANPG